MASATSPGREIMTAWLAPRSETVVAPMRAAILRSASGLIMRSSSETTYHEGNVRQAGVPDGRAGADGQLADQPVVGVAVAQHPAAAVHVEDRRQRPRGVRRPDDPHAHVADLGGDGDPAVLDRELVDRRGLDVIEHLAGPGGRELVDQWRRGGRLDERLGGGLEHDW